MSNTTIPTPQKGKKKLPASKLGKQLRRIADKIAASGEKPLSRQELEREVIDRRSGNF